jgi:hypothetical protein
MPRSKIFLAAFFLFWALVIFFTPRVIRYYWEKPDTMLSLPMCERALYRELSLDGKWKRLVKPVHLTTVCGLSGDADGWHIRGAGPRYDEDHRMIFTDTPIPGRAYEAGCIRKPLSSVNAGHVWAKEPGGLYCEVPLPPTTHATF